MVLATTGEHYLSETNVQKWTDKDVQLSSLRAS
jgi:hypothetical protein